MVAYHFRAVDRNDKMRSGQIEADDELLARRQLLDKGLFPIEIGIGRPLVLALLRRPIWKRSVSDRELAQWIGDLANLLKAGVELAPALTIMASNASTRVQRELTAQVLPEVRMGRPLSQAVLAGDTQVSAAVAAAIRAGEATGRLPDVLATIGTSLQRQAAVRAQAMTALIYPSFVAIAVSVAILVLLGVVVPAIETMFVDGLQRLPWHTRALIYVARFAQGHSLLIGFLAAAAIALARLSLRVAEVRAKVEKTLLSLPLVGRMLIASETTRATLLLTTLLEARLPMAQALELASEGVRLSITQAGLELASTRVRQGASLHSALSQVPTLARRALALVRVGESGGRLPALLGEAMRDSERELSTVIERALAMMTPALTLFFGAIAGFILYSVLIALLSVNELALQPM